MKLFSCFAAPRSCKSRRKPTFRPRFELLETRLAPAVHTWTGAGGDFRWSDPLNWENGSVPAANEFNLSLVFSAPVAGDAPTYSRNDITGLTVVSIEFSETLVHPAGDAEGSGLGYGYDLIGNSIVLTGDGSVSDQSSLLQRGPGLGGGIDRIDLPLVQRSDYTYEADFHDDLQILGQLSSTGYDTILKQGPGDMLLGNSTNDLGAIVDVEEGSLEISENAVAAATRFYVAAGATIYTDTNTFGSLVGAGTVTNINGTSPTLTIDMDKPDIYFGGVITGSISLVKAGTGTLDLAGPNNFTGSLTIQAGTLALDTGLVPDATLPPVAVTIDAGATLNLNGNGTEIGSLSGAGMVTNVPSIQPPDLPEGRLITGLDNTSTTFTGTITGQVTLVKVGTGTFTLGGVNQFSGHLTVAAGTLVVGVAGAIPDGLTGEVDVGATLLQNGYDVKFGSLSGGGTIDPIDGTLTTGSNNTSTTFSGVIAGGLALVKVGTGTFTLSGANTYTGPTTVLAGILQVTGSLSPSTIVTVAPGALLTGTAALTNVTVNGTGSGDVFVIDTTGVTLNGVPIVTAPYVSLTIDGLGGNDIFDVRGTNPGSTTILNAGGGGNTFNVGSSTDTLDPIQGLVVINGGGSDTLNVYDKGTSSEEEYTVTATQITRTPSGSASPTQTINYANVGYVNVYGGSGADLWAAEGTSPQTALTSLYSGSGIAHNANEIIVENTVDVLDDIQGPLALYGTAYDLAEAYDGLNTVGHNYILTTGLLQRDGVNISYDGIGAFIVATANNPYFGHTPNTVNVDSLGNVFAVVAVGTADTVTVGQNGSTANILGDLRIQSVLGQVPKQVSLDDSADTTAYNPPRTITLGSDPTFGYLVNGLANGSQGLGRIGLLLDPATPVALKTGASNQVFQIRDLAGVPRLSLAGSGTNNTLDYSAYTGDVKVNLGLGTATGLAGISGIENVTGGIGNSLLVGDANANVLIGGTGRNIIIGGGGADRLSEVAANTGDNILIAGTTSYDADPTQAALNAVFTEWTSNQSFDVRYGSLKSGTTVNGEYVILDKTTVHDDTADAATTLTLGGTGTNGTGTGRNWVFVDADGSDTITNPRANKFGDKTSKI